MENIKKLRKICQRPDCIQRTVSIYFTKLLLNTKITPNQVTLIDSVFGLSGALLFFIGTDWAFILGGILLQLFEIFDCVDGEIARYRRSKGMLKRSRTEENRAEFLQDLIHPLLHPLMFFGFSFGLYKTYSCTLILLLGYITALGMSLDTYVNTLREKLLNAPGLQASRAYKEMKKNARGIMEKIPLREYVIEFITFLAPVPGVITVIMFAPILDLLFVKSPIFLFNFFPLSFKTGTLVFYAVVQQLLWILNAKASIGIIEGQT